MKIKEEQKKIPSEGLESTPKINEKKVETENEDHFMDIMERKLSEFQKKGTPTKKSSIPEILERKPQKDEKRTLDSEAGEHYMDIIEQKLSEFQKKGTPTKKSSIPEIPERKTQKDEKRTLDSEAGEHFMDIMERKLSEFQKKDLQIVPSSEEVLEVEDSNFDDDFMDKLERDLIEYRKNSKLSTSKEKNSNYKNEFLVGFKAILFVDTCSFIKIKHQLIFDLIKDYKLILIVPLKIIDELEYRKQKREEDSRKAQQSLRFISELREKKLAFIDGIHFDPLSNTEEKVRGDNIIAGCIHWYFQNENLDVHFISDDYGAKLTVNSFTDNTYKNTNEFVVKFQKVRK
jgi:hypothetical protein